MPQEIKFVRIEGETSQELERRFEEFCVMVLRELEVYGAVITHVGSGDLGRDIIVEIFGMTLLFSAKHVQNGSKRQKLRIQSFCRTVEDRFAIEAHKSAERSGGDIIITMYNRMCQNIERFITARFNEQVRVLDRG
ncbi:hypothetical protein C2G38_2186641 [Gigaspora rosea]|uniref:Restriction endonuclease type IV Mrr domain-containing protein n=1 Tax=Gigaspora rosea TaxID=44941 RepID=A0A397V6M7_9GLOM|nr:hypothetical protein C2G38_2186641 [Gigaspora rosea]